MVKFAMSTDALSATLFAIADPTRRGLLARLARSDATVSELAAPYEMSLAAISKHLKVLESAGLISRGRQAQWRPVISKLRRCKRWPNGPRTTGRSGSATSTVSAITSN